MRIAFVLGSRGEWGYIRPIIREAEKRGHEASICATNMAVLPEYGDLASVISNEGFTVADRILCSVDGGSRAAMAKSIGVLILSMVDFLEREKPDWVILAGDRAEQLAAATACAYTYTPVAHVQAGERSGNIDGMARHAIGRLVHLHFAANEDAAQRLIRFGEEPWRVMNVGAPQLDELLDGDVTSPERLVNEGLRPSGPFVLGCFHPVTEDFDSIIEQVGVTLRVLRTQELPVVWILPNNDAGGAAVREQVLSGLRGIDAAFANLPREHFLGLLQSCQFLVGNSSSGLLEAPSFGTPAVNIGRRQRDRVHGPNVIHADPTVESISSALELAMEPGLRRALLHIPNPYGNGGSSPVIIDSLESTPRTDALLNKRLEY